MAIITTDKIVLIVVVTAIVIVMAYVFRFGRFSRRKQPGTNSDGSQQGSSDPNQGRLLSNNMEKPFRSAKQRMHR
jgi:hypothetical protein